VGVRKGSKVSVRVGGLVGEIACVEITGIVGAVTVGDGVSVSIGVGVSIGNVCAPQAANSRGIIRMREIFFIVTLLALLHLVW
jgi:hypothetical protein